MIYFLQSTEGGPIKIGTTEQPQTRFPQLETHYGKPLALLGKMRGGRAVERSIHERFAHLRLGKTEQFRPAPELLEFIGKPLLVGLNPEAVEPMPVSESRKPMVVQVRGSAEWKAWVEKVAIEDGSTMTALVARAVRCYAKTLGVEEPPPPR